MGGTGLLSRWSVGPFRRRPDGALQFDGARPGPGWHAHGYFASGLTFLEGDRYVLRRVFKRRWLDPGTGRTTHSRPPDALPYFRVSTVLVVVLLASFVGIALPELDAVELDEVRSRRSVQRWHARAVGVGLHVQQAIRHALIERCEPRPVEHLFEGGLSPPRSAADLPQVTTLSRGLLMSIIGARGLAVPLAVLLAEARGRWTGPTDRFPI